jgi:putative acetyltransferase
MEVRSEKPQDLEAIRRVNIAAFGRVGEADLVDQLRGIRPTFSFVAVKSSQIVGHLFFSPVEVVGKCVDNFPILGLAPLAVLPEYQRQGIGAMLIHYGMEECTRLGFKAVVVLGSPAYYPLLGFTPAKEKRLRCEYSVPDEAFMVLELESGALARCVGIVRYRPEFNKLE